MVSTKLIDLFNHIIVILDAHPKKFPQIIRQLKMDLRGSWAHIGVGRGRNDVKIVLTHEILNKF